MMTPDQFALLLRREAIVDELLVHRPVPAALPRRLRPPITDCP